MAFRKRTKNSTIFYYAYFFSVSVSLLQVGDFFPEHISEDEIQRARFKNLGQFECMYIMADLSEEIQLFSIKYRSNDGLLLIYPDLNNIDANPYLKEIIIDSRHLYQFAMENLSMDYCQNEVIQLKSDIELLANKVSYCVSSHSKMLANLIVYRPPPRLNAYLHSVLSFYSSFFRYCTSIYSYQICALKRHSCSTCLSDKMRSFASISRYKWLNILNMMTFM